jgi:membrane-bound serine protease (ClpP class)
VGAEALLGATARAVSPLEPYGHVRINGELWRARAAPGPIRSDQDVVVRDLEGLTLVVEPGPLVIRSGDGRGAR